MYTIKSAVLSFIFLYKIAFKMADVNGNPHTSYRKAIF